MEHGAIAVHQLPDLFRVLELGNTLPLARLAHGAPKDCKQALDSGADGVIVPMVETAAQLVEVLTRAVGRRQGLVVWVSPVRIFLGSASMNIRLKH